MRPSSRKLQESTSSQNRNRTMRARNVIAPNRVTAFVPSVPLKWVYVRRKGVVKRKRVNSRGCGKRRETEEGLPVAGVVHKSLFYNTLVKTRLPAAEY